jgi:hypothetical protein
MTGHVTQGADDAAIGARGRVLVAMSGGVDSSVAAALLVEQGYDVVGATMKLFCYGDDVPDRPCCSLDSINDARRVCERLGVPHYVLDLEDRFGHDVVRDFVDEYARGRTPIPCVRCNTFTKFRDLLRTAELVDAQWIATGHYARVVDGALLCGRDAAKDQTYFLWGIDRRVVGRMLLPVGDLTKVETRAIARRLGLSVVADKVESQDICFVPDGDHTKVIRRTLGADAPRGTRGSRSGSGAGCPAGSRSRCSSSRSAPPIARWSSARARRCSGAAWWPARSTGWRTCRRRAPRSRSGFGTARVRCRRRSCAPSRARSSSPSTSRWRR